MPPSSSSSKQKDTVRIVLPGDDVTDHILPTSTSKTNTKKQQQPKIPKIGSGLKHDIATNRVIATQAGQLFRHSNTYYVRSNRRRYIPRENDNVIGIVEDRFMGEYYRVNIFGPHPAILNQLAFEGATKRNRPHYTPGTLIYARVITTDPDLDPELSCKVGDTIGASRKDWMTDEGTYGELKGGGMDFRVSLGLARELLKPQNVVLNALGERVAFEIAIGVNGVVWCNAKKEEEIVLICNAIQNSEVMNDSQIRKMVEELFANIRKD